MTSEVEWRRRWTPDLAAQPWRPLSISGQNFLLKSRIGDDSYELLVSDTACLWYENLDEDGVRSRTKRLNPSVEAPVSKLLDHIRDTLETADTKNKDVKLSATFKNCADSDDQKMLITLSTKLAGLPFVWKFSAAPADSKMVSDHLTVPLLAMVGELSRRQSELYKLLRNKDKEIDDLKSQGIKVTRKHLETPVFDETIFKHTMTTSKDFTEQVSGECTKAFDSEGRDLYRDIMTKHAYLNRPEGEDVDYDEGTFSADGEGDSVGGTTGPSWANRLPPSLAGGSSSSPRKSPAKSPTKSPGKASRDASPTKNAADLEQLRREELEQRLEAEEQRKEQKKKKKKMKF